MNEEVKTVPAIIYIPESAVKITVVADIIDKDLNISKAVTELDMPALNEAKISGYDWEDDNAKYELTDEAMEELGLT